MAKVVPMNRLEDSPLFQSLNTLIDRLTEIWGSGKGELSVAEIFLTVRAIEQIGKEGEGFLAEMQELLENSAVHEELAGIVAQCQEESPASPTVRELIARLGGWRDGFRDMLPKIREQEQARRAQQRCQLLRQNREEFQTEVLGSDLLKPALKRKLIKNLLDWENRLLPDADLDLLATELERLKSAFAEATGEPAAPPPEQPPVPETAAETAEASPEWLLDRLRQIQPKESNSIPEVQKIQKQVTSEANHEVLVNAVNLLEAENLFSATWLKAMFVSSYLEVARSGSESLSEVLNSLEDNSQNWLSGNWHVEAVAIRVFQSLEEFSSNYPSLLSLDKIYGFFLAAAGGDGRQPALQDRNYPGAPVLGFGEVALTGVRVPSESAVARGPGAEPQAKPCRSHAAQTAGGVSGEFRRVVGRERQLPARRRYNEGGSSQNN
jgi:hypothetical protein